MARWVQSVPGWHLCTDWRPTTIYCQSQVGSGISIVAHQARKPEPARSLGCQAYVLAWSEVETSKPEPTARPTSRKEARSSQLMQAGPKGQPRFRRRAPPLVQDIENGARYI